MLIEKDFSLFTILLLKVGFLKTISLERTVNCSLFYTKQCIYLHIDICVYRKSFCSYVKCV